MDQGTDHFKRIEGVDLHWAEFGAARNSVPVILLHGLCDSHLTWRRVLPRLASGRHILTPNLPGHGLSERADASYDLDWYGRVIASWIESLGFDQVDIVGHSFGGGIAQMLLLKCPDRIRRLVLVSSGGLGRDVSFWLRLATIPYVVERFGQPFMGLGTRLALLPLKELFSKAEFEEIIEMNKKDGSARTLARTVKDIIDWRGQTRGFFQRAAELERLPPIAVIWGERDSMIPISHGRTFTESFEGVRLAEIAGCGHYLHHEKPETFAEVVNEFLDASRVPEPSLRGSQGDAS